MFVGVGIHYATRMNHIIICDLPRYTISFHRNVIIGKTIIIGIKPLGQFGLEPEPSQVTGMALVRCILGEFLGVVCHCFPPKIKIWNASRFCVSSLGRGHVNLLCIVPIFSICTADGNILEKKLFSTK